MTRLKLSTDTYQKWSEHMIEIPKKVYEAVDTLNNFCCKYNECEADNCPFYDKEYDDCSLNSRNPCSYHHIILEHDGKYYARVEEENRRQLGR